MSFVLVRWPEDNSVGVMPTSAAEKGVELYPGAEVRMKWKKKMYDAEILKVSSKLAC